MPIKTDEWRELESITDETSEHLIKELEENVARGDVNPNRWPKPTTIGWRAFWHGAPLVVPEKALERNMGDLWYRGYMIGYRCACNGGAVPLPVSEVRAGMAWNAGKELIHEVSNAKGKLVLVIHNLEGQELRKLPYSPSHIVWVNSASKGTRTFRKPMSPGEINNLKNWRGISKDDPLTPLKKDHFLHQLYEETMHRDDIQHRDEATAAVERDKDRTSETEIVKKRRGRPRKNKIAEKKPDATSPPKPVAHIPVVDSPFQILMKMMKHLDGPVSSVRITDAAMFVTVDSQNNDWEVHGADLEAMSQEVLRKLSALRRLEHCGLERRWQWLPPPLELEKTALQSAGRG